MFWTRRVFILRSFWTQLTENVPLNILTGTLVERSFKILAQKHHSWNIFMQRFSVFNLFKHEYKFMMFQRTFKSNHQVCKMLKCSIPLNITFIQPIKKCFLLEIVTYSKNVRVSCFCWALNIFWRMLFGYLRSSKGLLCSTRKKLVQVSWVSCPFN